MSFARPPRAADWADTVAGPLRQPDLPARALFRAALARPPLWLGAAMVLRNMLVAPLRLRRGPPGEGHFLERLPVLVDAPDQFEIGLPDRHLTFTLAVRKRAGKVFVTTSIWFNAWTGRVYLRLILPGHILATRQMTGRIAHPLRRLRGDPFEGEPA